MATHNEQSLEEDVNGHGVDGASTPSLYKTNGHDSQAGVNGDTPKSALNGQQHDARAEDSVQDEVHVSSDTTQDTEAHDPEADESFRSGELTVGGDEEDEEDEGGSEYEDDDEEDEEEMEDEEPALKYERMGGSTHELLDRDSASSLAVSSKLFVSIHS
jgi:hypothetical protein